jgi:cytochrome P450
MAKPRPFSLLIPKPLSNMSTPHTSESCPLHNPMNPTDPFREPREKNGYLVNEFQGVSIPLFLRHEEVRKAAKDWQTFSSDAPFKVPIPTEEDVRTVRQLPLEVDPPEQKDYRTLVEPFFNRARQPEVIERMNQLIAALIENSIQAGPTELVRQFAIPLQSHALAILLDMPDSEADVWIGWGTHVFREGDGTSKGAALEAYTNHLLDRAAQNPGSDFFSAMTQASLHGRPLTREEMLGYCSIVFAGGRDTVINSITGILAHLAEKPADLEYLRADPKRIIGASEEFFRVLSPVTHLARKCPHGANIHGIEVPPGDFISLCFSSANFDATVFDQPDETRLDRKPNPHVAFGFGPHLCLGAAHARLIARALLQCLCDRVANIEKISEIPKYENETRYRRRLAYDSLTVRLHPIERKIA